MCEELRKESLRKISSSFKSELSPRQEGPERVFPLPVPVGMAGCMATRNAVCLILESMRGVALGCHVTLAGLRLEPKLVVMSILYTVVFHSWCAHIRTPNGKPVTPVLLRGQWAVVLRQRHCALLRDN